MIDGINQTIPVVRLVEHDNQRPDRNINTQPGMIFDDVPNTNARHVLFLSNSITSWLVPLLLDSVRLGSTKA